MKRYLVMLMTLVMLVACQSRLVTFSLEKDGVLYNYSEIVTFYHPRNWKVTKDELKLSLDIVNENEKEALYFDVFDIEEVNTADELIALYEAKLKELSIDVQVVNKTLLSSGQNCYYISGEIKKNDAAFCEVVTFVGNRQYIYSYIAQKDVYHKQQEMMMNYLNSLVINEVMKTAL